ncbi:MAG TPA: hypothetical protein VK923_03560 [Euzebyales bacterium]|nr:hypothetical protein [Euzebyales bacterium]
MWRGRRPEPTTLAAAGMMGAVSIVFGAYGAAELPTAGDSGPVASRDAVLLGISGREEGVATVMAVVVILAVSALTLSLAVGVLRRREGARYAALMTFGMLGLLALAASLPGLMSTPPRSGAPFGVLTGLVDLGIVALLLLPATADDIEDAERARERAATRR